jgi:hypothetical protein
MNKSTEIFKIEQPEVGIPFPVEVAFKDALNDLIDDFRGKMSYGQAAGILERVKLDLLQEMDF